MKPRNNNPISSRVEKILEANKQTSYSSLQQKILEAKMQEPYFPQTDGWMVLFGIGDNIHLLRVNRERRGKTKLQSSHGMKIQWFRSHNYHAIKYLESNYIL